MLMRIWRSLLLVLSTVASTAGRFSLLDWWKDIIYFQERFQVGLPLTEKEEPIG